MNILSENQRMQEDEYEFPYHHLVDYDEKAVSLFRYWGWALNYLGRIDAVLRVLSRISFENFLDVGSGDGKLISVLSKKFKDRKFLGLDYSVRAVEFAEMFCSSQNVAYEVENVWLSEKKPIYDVVASIEVLEHIPPTLDRLPTSLNLHTFLLNIRKYMKPNGYFICTVPSVLLRVPGKHYQHFSFDSLSRALQESGFQVEHMEGIDASSLLLACTRRLFVNQLYVIRNRRLQSLLFRLYKKFWLYN